MTRRGRSRVSHEMAGIFSTLEDAPRPPSPEPGPVLSCEICARRRPRVDTHLFLAKFRAETEPGDDGYRTLVRCRDAADCRATVEAFGEAWPLDDRTPAPLPSVVRTDADHAFSMPAVEVAPDPPDPAAASTATPASVQATSAPLYDDLDSDWRGF